MRGTINNSGVMKAERSEIFNSKLFSVLSEILVSEKKSQQNVWVAKKSKVENFYEAEIPCTGFCLLVPLLSQSFGRYSWWQYLTLSIF